MQKKPRFSKIEQTKFFPAAIFPAKQKIGMPREISFSFILQFLSSRTFRLAIFSDFQRGIINIENLIPVPVSASRIIRPNADVIELLGATFKIDGGVNRIFCFQL